FVAYQVVRQEEQWGAMTTVRYRMYRSVARPGYSTDTTKLSAYELGNDIRNYRPTGLASMTNSDDPFDPGTIEIPHPSMVIADGVVDFGMIAYDAEGNQINFVNNSGVYSIPNNELAHIRSITIFIRLLTEDGAQLLSQYELSGGEDLNWWDDI